MTSTSLETLDYAQPVQARRPASVKGSQACLGLSVISLLIGVLILLAYRFTANDDLVGAGALWLTVGGGMTSACLIAAIVMLATIRRNALNAKPARANYVRALVVTLVSYPIAFGCIVLGADWAQGPHFRLRVYNDTKVDLQRVIVRFGDERIDVGPVLAGGSVTTGLNWRGTPGDVNVTLQAAGQERTFRDRFVGSEFHLQQPYFDVRIEPVELPRLLRPQGP